MPHPGSRSSFAPADCCFDARLNDGKAFLARRANLDKKAGWSLDEGDPGVTNVAAPLEAFDV